jgi:hypothetical protein
MNIKMLNEFIAALRAGGVRDNLVAEVVKYRDSLEDEAAYIAWPALSANAPKHEWKDVTSYSRGVRFQPTGEKIEPRTWLLVVGGFQITVTKYIGYGDEWTIHAPHLRITTNIGLGTTDVEEAKRLAQERCLFKCQEQIDKLKELEHTMERMLGI